MQVQQEENNQSISAADIRTSAEEGKLYWYGGKQSTDWKLVRMPESSNDSTKILEMDLINNDNVPEKIRIENSNDSADDPMLYPVNNNQNEGSLEKKTYADMTSMAFINEPNILQNLHDRFTLKQPYTLMSNILLAVNPLCRLPSVDKSSYYQQSLNNSPPHPYYVAEVAYRQLRRNSSESQSIIISGESGAGKTETSKIILNYLTTCAIEESNNNQVVASEKYHTRSRRSNTVYDDDTDNSTSNNQEDTSGFYNNTSDHHDPIGSIGERLMESIPIAESFGNAKTGRNYNSSRFGKYMRLQFDKSALVSASIDSYLLEQSRLVSQSSGERNFHIFYQLIAGANSTQVKDMHLGKCDDYHYLNKSGCTSDSRLNDAKDFHILNDAMDFVGVGYDAIKSDVFSIVAGLLHLGNVALKEVDSSEGNVAALADDQAYLSLLNASTLLGVDSDFLLGTILKRKIVSGAACSTSSSSSFSQSSNTTSTSTTNTSSFHERTSRVSIYHVKRTMVNAIYTRDTIAKKIYNNLFTWLMKKVASSLSTTSSSSSLPYIGVLDIYGFEQFDTNGFEQLLINFANESLQRIFNKAVFDDEQQLYKDECLVDTNTNTSTSKFFQLRDNLECLSLLSGGAKTGIFAMMDNISRMPQPTDQKLLDSMHKEFLNNEEFTNVYIAPHLKDRRNTFIIRHYANTVTYCVDNCLEKNTNVVSDEIEDLIQSSKVSTLECYDDEGVLSPEKPVAALTRTDSMNSTTTPRGGSIWKSSSVSSVFVSQMTGLVEELKATKCNYIRCIKPNDALQANVFDRSRVLQQLRNNGTIQACEVLTQGLPTRIGYEELLELYKTKLPTGANVHFFKSIKDFVEALLWAYDVPRSTYQLGLTKLFFKAGNLNLLDKIFLTENKDNEAFITSRLRQYRVCKSWKKALASVKVLNRFTALMTASREKFASIVMQSVARVILAKATLRKLRRLNNVRLVWQRAFRRVRATKVLRVSDQLRMLHGVRAQRHPLYQFIKSRQKARLRRWNTISSQVFINVTMAETYEDTRDFVAAFTIQRNVKSVYDVRRAKLAAKKKQARKYWRRIRLQFRCEMVFKNLYFKIQSKALAATVKTLKSDIENLKDVQEKLLRENNDQHVQHRTDKHFFKLYQDSQLMLLEQSRMTVEDVRAAAVRSTSFFNAEKQLLDDSVSKTKDLLLKSESQCHARDEKYKVLVSQHVCLQKKNSEMEDEISKLQQNFADTVKSATLFRTASKKEQDLLKGRYEAMKTELLGEIDVQKKCVVTALELHNNFKKEAEQAAERLEMRTNDIESAVFIRHDCHVAIAREKERKRKSRKGIGSRIFSVFVCNAK